MILDLFCLFIAAFTICSIKKEDHKEMLYFRNYSVFIGNECSRCLCCNLVVKN